MKPNAFLLVGLSFCLHSCAMPQEQAIDKEEYAAAMRELRSQMLLLSASDAGIKPSAECPHVYGVLMDWPMQGTDAIGTIVSLCDGNASLYTNGTFGILGGFAHERVNLAARAFVHEANGHFMKAKPTSDRSYPPPDQVRFYLLTFEGVRLLEEDRKSVEDGDSVYSELFAKGQQVLTELRQLPAVGNPD